MRFSGILGQEERVTWLWPCGLDTSLVPARLCPSAVKSSTTQLVILSKEFVTMELLSTRPEDLSDSEIIERCFNPNRQVIGGLMYGNRVVKLSEEIVVKFGRGVTAEEADNQRRVTELLDRNIVRIPQVYRFFTRLVKGAPRGFLVMEYIHGHFSESPNSRQINQLAQILSYFASIHGEHPGPLQRGVSRGLLWEENGKPAFESIQQMERWLNFRLPDVEAKKLALEKYPLVLCHLDLAPRNILWLDDGSVCLLDWASAGFYPRFFEVSLLKLMEYTHGDYETTLITRMERLTDDEEAQISLLSSSFHNGIGRWFVSPYIFSTV